MSSRCIYSLCDEESAHFKQSEHIIPKAIGGIYTLQKGAVSDEVNHEFSKIEDQVIHDCPMIAISRSLFGPKGRKKHTRVYGVTFLKEESSGRPEIGYLLQGKPYPIHQVIVSLDKHDQILETFGVTLPENAGYVDNSDTVFKNFIKSILSLSGKFRIIQAKNNIMLNKLIVGFEKKQLYIGIHSRFSKENAVSMGKRLLEIMRQVLNDDMQTKSLSGCLHYKNQVTIHYTYKISFPLLYRFCAKVSFNALARVLNDDRIYSPEYDPIRQAILTGNDIEQFVRLSLEEDHKQRHFNFLNILGFGKRAHGVFFVKEKNFLIAEVFFYGNSLVAMVKIAQVPEPSKPFDLTGYICDWEHGKEGTLESFLHMLHDKNERSEVKFRNTL